MKHILPKTSSESAPDVVRAARLISSFLVPGTAAAAVLLASRGGVAGAGAAFCLVCIGSFLLGYARVGRIQPTSWLQDGAVAGLVVLCTRSDLPVWFIPDAPGQIFRFSAVGGVAAMVFYLCTAFGPPVFSGRRPSARQRLVFAAVPFFFSALFAIGSTELTLAVGSTMSAAWGEAHARLLGRGVLLTLLNVSAAHLIALATSGRIPKEIRLYGILILAAVTAVLSPLAADFASGAWAARHDMTTRLLLAPFCAGAAQAGLWFEVFLLTGLFMDGLHGKPPTSHWAWVHSRKGVVRGMIFGAVFMGIVQACYFISSAVPSVPSGAFMAVVLWSVLGAFVFPLAKTVVESFDGSPPFFSRLRDSLCTPRNYARGAVGGVLCTVVVSLGIVGMESLDRFGMGFLAGALVYAGVDAVADRLRVFTGTLGAMRSLRWYVLGILLGGVAGGAVAWYFDPFQLAAVTGKFFRYATINFPASGESLSRYVIYPLFSKWGAVDLGLPAGGVRLLYDESLSGVINWSLAAPLFSINLVLLKALFARSFTPIRSTFTRAGGVELVEQLVRVLRWGLWMAPIVYSFLRMMPAPTWYNQDGALRTLAAIWKSLTLDSVEFRAWSLWLFTSMLIYDWLRILIWVDHMGLRVATLVNLSFVGADALDEAAARRLGFAITTRIFPEGLRRFFTWMPLLIPFYLPRGEEWNIAWGTMERAAALARPGPTLTAAAVTHLSLFVAAGAGLTTVVISALRSRRAPVLSPPERFDLNNGVYGCRLDSTGRGNSRAVSLVRPEDELDITLRGYGAKPEETRCIFLQDAEEPDIITTLLPVDGKELLRTEAAFHSVHPTAVESVRSLPGLNVTVRVEVDASARAERWFVRVTNEGNRTRRVRLTTMQRFVMHSSQAASRHPRFNALHVQTLFLASAGMIMAQNRLLREKNVPGRISREVGFHAFAQGDHPAFRLTGYEDSRSRFVGLKGMRRPAGLTGALRDLRDEGWCTSFDPAAVLRVEADIQPGASAEAVFLTGYARSPQAALDLLTRLDPCCRISRSVIFRALNRIRKTDPSSGQEKTRFVFSEDGLELRFTPDMVRPWTHMAANEAGYGFVVNSHGRHFSFFQNSQQNGITPFDQDTCADGAPGQGWLCLDLESGRVFLPAAAASPGESARRETIFGAGYALFLCEEDALSFRSTVAVSPDQPVEKVSLEIGNAGQYPRRLRICRYARIVLAEVEADSAGQIRGGWEEAGSAFFFERPEHQFRKGTLFVAPFFAPTAQTSEYPQFEGGQGTESSLPYLLLHGRPDAERRRNGYRVAAMTMDIRIDPCSSRRLQVVTGQTENRESAEMLIASLRDQNNGDGVDEARQWWSRELSVVRVRTTDAEFDRLVNIWLPYQILTSRLWGRCGPDQRSGGYGFRDQLQDVLPLLLLCPERAREQIIFHARQQFFAGDVLHWWHQGPEGETGLGPRSTASDLHLWLPYVVHAYIRATGDVSLLDETVPYLEETPIPRGRQGVVTAQLRSARHEDIFTHCLRALRFSRERTGKNGLPLIGSGDWNDGFDELGVRGRGESGWLGFLLFNVQTGFADLARKRGEHALAHEWTKSADALHTCLEKSWRHDRFLRATDDNGKELLGVGALMSAWPTLSDAALGEMSRRVLENGCEALLREAAVLLAESPFTGESDPFPGRVAQYPPGVRENGGQYSHGVSWMVDAFVEQSKRAFASGDAAGAAALLRKAERVWFRISPLEHARQPERFPLYGLSPHQQAADVSWGEGYEGRGGWSWYTGAAALMLSAAYMLLGLAMDDGVARVDVSLHSFLEKVRVLEIIHCGRTLFREE